MAKPWKIVLVGLLQVALGAAGPFCLSVQAKVGQEGDGPRIDHDPVRVAVRGQPVALLAKVTPREDAIRDVTLYYSLSRHSAPLKIKMQSTAMGLYSGRIPGSYLQRAGTLYYYIEAEDVGDRWTETTWQAVDVKAPPPAVPAAPAPIATKKPPASSRSVATEPVARSAPQSQSQPQSERKWVAPVLIGAGAVGVVGAAVAIAGSGGGGGSSTPAEDTTQDFSGLYGGSVVLCQTPGGGDTTCETTAITLTLDGTNATSANLNGGSAANGTVIGDRVTFSGLAAEVTAGADGSIVYAGTVRDQTISGTIQGTATTATGIINYSGAWTAFLQ